MDSSRFSILQVICIFFLLALLLAGCAMVPVPSRSDRIGQNGPLGSCADFFASLDKRTEKAGVNDPGVFRVKNYPLSKDHVHLVVSIPPKQEVSDVIGTIKGRVAIRIFKHMPEIRKKYWGRRFWSRGYFVSTIGVDETIIRQYVQKRGVKERLAEQLGFDL